MPGSTHGSSLHPPPAAGVGYTDLTAENFEAVYDDLLAPAFPPAELTDRVQLRAAYVDGDAPAVVAVRDDEPVAVALGEYHAPTGLLLLGYLAVHADERGTGVGSTTLRSAIDVWRRTLRPRAVLAEIEDPRVHRSRAYGDPVRRLRFYARLGAAALPIPYFQPALSATQSRVPGMLLICLPPRADTIATEPVACFLDDYVAECEGPAVRDGDREYRALRGQLTALGPQARLVPLERFVPAVPATP